MFCSLVLTTLLCSANADQAAAPKWQVLAKLFNQHKDSKEVTSFVQNHRLIEATKGPSGAFTSNDNSYSIMYRGSRVDTIVLRVSQFPRGHGEEHWRAYSQDLPGKLTSRDGREEVVKKLGVPVKSRKDTWLLGDLYIWVHFNEKQKSIDQLYVSRKIIEAPQ